MNTGPAERITNVRKKLAAAVGIKPKSAITIIVLVEGIGGSPSTISAMGMTIAADMINNTVDSPMVSTAGKRRIIMELIP
jgi:hypothetical protein